MKVTYPHNHSVYSRQYDRIYRIKRRKLMKENLSGTKTEQPPTDPFYKGFSNNILLVEFYQAIPKFYYGDQSKIRIDGQFLHSLDREFSFDGTLFRAIISPCRIQEDGDIISYFAGDAEKQVEQVIWKLAYDHRRQYPFDFSVVFNFSANSIQAELSRKGYNFPTDEITKSIKILGATNIEIQFESDNLKGSFEMLYPISFLDISYGEITTYGMKLNPYFMTSLDEGKFQPDYRGR